MPEAPISSDHLLSAARWIEAALLSSVATAIAVTAIAIVGLAMLTGRVELRRGATVVIGCFVLFGSPAIAAGLLRFVPRQPAVAPSLLSPMPLLPRAPKPTAYDPYASAAVPRAR